ncbi:MAG: YggS family pyridoxal phosphate-dependent enzyme [Desulfuromonadales bacterium]|nr:YggS family pyridoxal phosphate-dependent enzyme [Desulfuromonadales bacterium]
MSIASNLTEIRARIDAACQRCQRDPASVRLVAVSKTHPATSVDEAAAAGQELFGENYVQEFAAKAEEVAAPVQWHFIGSLQSNKVKYLAGKVAMIHSVDRLSLAEELDRQWGKLGQTLEILIEVNLGDEDSKGGASTDAAIDLVRRIATLPHLKICGLMALPPFLEDAKAVRPYFRRLRELSIEIDAANIPCVVMRELSMGMSHDFEVAIEEGATLVRVGTAIFGARGAKA